MVSELDESILQRVRRALARRRPDASPREVLLLGIGAQRLAGHVQYLIDAGEAEGWIVEREGVPIPLVRGGLTPLGWAAMLDRSATDTARQASWLARLKSGLKTLGSRVIDLGWKVAAGVAIAALLAVIGLS